MFHNPFTHARFFELLLKYDEDISREIKARGCRHCGEVLDQANYERKPRGLPDDIIEGFDIRFSLCCRREGCRKRELPPSVRFLGAHVYIALSIVLASSSSEKLRAYVISQFNISRKTLQRWQKFWASRFKNSEFWRAHQGDGLLWKTVGDNIPDRLLAGFINSGDGQGILGYFELLKFCSPFSE
jgi:hypothetical protein